MKSIVIKGARQNNLKNIDVKIPRNQIVVFTGVSGSGKSSLVFETINAEAQRQLYDTFSTFARRRMPKYEQADYDAVENLSPAVLIEQKRFSGNSLIIIEHNLDVINCTDWIVDIGPEGGVGGRELIFKGTPDQIVDCNESYTWRYLKMYRQSVEG